ncbi:DUF2304 domain-containing protein [Kineococcus rhizosphaerae]|uniref:DUF2304 domain-containing protein n=1 Tax=Kineococcus rhizosphaerae TaxID=559628 RepID=A0A2T0R0G0_9ACTN|nr:DUF2304 domain-containing protein [Kineococcus rhizosphaerae]PRY12593.1 hypothetical protein CLV37_110153 [Kineococcus rhizosphaerae]
MLVIQVLLIAVVLVVGVFLVRSTAGARHQAVRRLLLAALVALAVASILVPTAVTAVANVVGVGRGADLLLYGLVIAFLGFVVSSYRRSKALEETVTQLARRLALDEAVTPEQARHREGDGPAQEG